MRKLLLSIITFGFFILLFQGCGYKPTSHYTKDEIKGKVYVAIKIDINNTINSILIKDTVSEMIVHKFAASLTNDIKQADTIINISLGSILFDSLQSDTEGYAKLYRTSLTINLNYQNIIKKTSKNVKLQGSYDYYINSDSLITDAKKTESLKIAATEALNDFFSSIAIQSFQQ